MGKILHFMLFDMRHIFRDGMLRIFLLVPFILVGLAYWGVPKFFGAFAELRAYEVYVWMGLCMQTAILMGFISAFILLEEKDQQILPILRVLPISAGFFIGYRLGFAVGTSFLTAAVMLGLLGLGGLEVGLLAFQFSLVSALIVLLVGGLAQNKIEGLALFKGLDLLLMLPMISFFVSEYVGYGFGFLPMYWTFHWFEAAYVGVGGLGWALGGFVVFGLYLAAGFWWFKRRVYEA